MNNLEQIFDVVVIGAGPAGLGAAISLGKQGVKVALLEAGRPYTKRRCPVDLQRSCTGCGTVCNVISGFGGCIHYGDGVKLSRFPSGRRLLDALGVELAAELSAQAEQLLFGNLDVAFRPAGEFHGSFNLKAYDIATLGESHVRELVAGLHHTVSSSEAIDIFQNTRAVKLERLHEGFRTTCSGPGRPSELIINSRRIVIAVGRYGRRWWRETMADLRVDSSAPTPSVGLRFELPAKYTRIMSETHPDFKTSIKFGNNKIKTFCFCAGSGGGQIKFTDYGDVTLLDGHVTPEADHATSNFALLVQLFDEDGMPATEDWVQKNIIAPYRGLRRDRPGKPVVQTYNDFKIKQLNCRGIEQFKSETGINPSLSDYEFANISSIFSDEIHNAFYSVFESIADQLSIDNRVNVADILSSTLVIALELENMWDMVVVDQYMECNLPGIHVCGDCNGLAQGILQSFVSGVAVARHPSFSGELV